MIIWIARLPNFIIIKFCFIWRDMYMCTYKHECDFLVYLKNALLNCQLLLILIQPISHHFHFFKNITQSKFACDKQSLKRNIWKKFVKLPQSLLLTVSISERKTKFSLTSTFSLLYLFPFNINSSLLWCLWYVSYTQAFCIFCLMLLLQCSKIKDDIKC